MMTTSLRDTFSGPAPMHPVDQATALHNVEEPTDTDVLSGRGVTTNKHPGNVNFRSLVALNKELYVTSTKKQKMSISRSIVDAVRSMNPPGRFLDKDPVTGLWSDIGDRKAIEKTSQALRDGAATLRKQLSKDLGDPDFLSAVFEMDTSAKSTLSLKDKAKPAKAKPVRKVHRRTKSDPKTLTEKKKVIKKMRAASNEHSEPLHHHHGANPPRTMGRMRSPGASPVSNRSTFERASSFDYAHGGQYRGPSPPGVPYHYHPHYYHPSPNQQGRPLKSNSFDSGMSYGQPRYSPRHSPPSRGGRPLHPGHPAHSHPGYPHHPPLSPTSAGAYPPPPPPSRHLSLSPSGGHGGSGYGHHPHPPHRASWSPSSYGRGASPKLWGSSPTNFPSYGGGDLSVPSLARPPSASSYPTSPRSTYSASPVNNAPSVVRCASAEDFAPPPKAPPSWRYRAAMEQHKVLESKEYVPTPPASPDHTASMSEDDHNDTGSSEARDSPEELGEPEHNHTRIMVSNSEDAGDAEMPLRSDIEVVWSKGSEESELDDVSMLMDSDDMLDDRDEQENEEKKNGKASAPSVVQQHPPTPIAIKSGGQVDVSFSPLPYADSDGESGDHVGNACAGAANFLEMIPEMLLKMPIAPCGPQDE